MIDNEDLGALIRSNETFKRILNGHILHALVFVGNDPAYNLAFCRELVCGMLSKCGRDDLASKARRGLLVDQVVFDGTDTIKVGVISNIIEKATEKGIESDQKFCIINSAQRMTPEAQNKLLKTLEEPNSDQYFFLCVPSRFLLLPTILSRSTIVELGGIDKSQIVEFLMKIGQDAKTAQTASEISMGSLDKALAIGGKTDNNFELALDLLSGIDSSADCWKFAAKIPKADISNLFSFCEQIILDALKLKHGCESIWFSSKKAEIKRLSTVSSIGLIFIYNNIQQLKKLATVNVSLVVLADKLALAIAEGKHKK